MDVLSIDFGTSFTAAAIASNGVVSVLAFSRDGATRIPSSVFWNANEGRLIVGTDADNHAAMNPSLYEATPKRWVGLGQVPLAGVEVSDVDCVAAVLAEVASEVRYQRDGRLPSKVVLTHPAAWREHKLAVLIQAAERAGLAEPTLIAEPCAAAAYFAASSDHKLGANEALCVYDLGGGTFDIAVVVAGDDGYELAAQPDGVDPLGGETFDHRLFEHVGKYIAGRDSTVWAHLEVPDTESWARNRRLLLVEIRAAKEALSKVSSHDLFIPGLDQSLLLTRHELETLIADDIDRTIDITLAAVARTDYTPATLRGIYLAGGSSRIPMVAQKLYDRADTPPHTVDDPKLVVVKGAATANIAPTGIDDPAKHRNSKVDPEDPNVEPGSQPAATRAKYASIAAGVGYSILALSLAIDGASEIIATPTLSRVVALAALYAVAALLSGAFFRRVGPIGTVALLSVAVPSSVAGWFLVLLSPTTALEVGYAAEVSDLYLVLGMNIVGAIGALGALCASIVYRANSRMWQVAIFSGLSCIANVLFAVDAGMEVASILADPQGGWNEPGWFAVPNLLVLASAILAAIIAWSWFTDKEPTRA